MMLKVILNMALLLSMLFVSRPAQGEAAVRFRFSDATGIGHEDGICRRDPSDVIRAGDRWYVWYSKVTRDEALYPSGYRATVWYAVSTDSGNTWEEKGEAVGCGTEGYDSHAVFTPNILAADGKYYLSFTAVAKGFTNREYTDVNRTAIGMAVSDSPDGPWEKLPGNPILGSVKNPDRFDSFRVDDSCFIQRDGKYWMYYKGRQWENTPGHTKMGVAVAEKPEGPYTRLNDGRFVQDSGHEVMVWPWRGGVVSLVSDTGKNGRTLQYAEDGIHFRVLGKLPEEYPKAPGAYRPDMTGHEIPVGGIAWGIAMIQCADPYLIRYEITIDRQVLDGLKQEAAERH